MADPKPMKLKMLTIPAGMDLELIFDDPDIETLDDLDIGVNYFGSSLKLSITKKEKDQ